VYGIYNSNTSSTIDSNVVTGISGGGSVYGIYMASGEMHDVRQNRVYNLSSTTASSTVYGLFAASSVTGNIYNNMIYDIRSTASTSAIGTIGLYPSGGAGATMNVFYNTVYLDYVSTGASNTSSALYVATSLLVNIRNNIFVNKCDMTTGTRAVAIRKSSTSYSNLASNNNLFYAGTPGPKNVIFYDGTNSDETLAAYKLRIAPNDQASVTEDPPFVSNVNPYNLHMSTTDSTAAESGGQIISSPISVQDDFDANPRFGAPGYAGTGSAPDLGADEFDGVGPDLVGPIDQLRRAFCSAGDQPRGLPDREYLRPERSQHHRRHSTAHVLQTDDGHKHLRREYQRRHRLEVCRSDGERTVLVLCRPQSAVWWRTGGQRRCNSVFRYCSGYSRDSERWGQYRHVCSTADQCGALGIEFPGDWLVEQLRHQACAHRGIYHWRA
jgi:hypothetical protein